MQERNPTLLDPVAELREDSRKHGERADHRNTDDHHRADRERHERLVAREEHPRHGDHHGQAGDEHCTTRGGSCSFDRRALTSPCRPLFTRATEVEERVVDTDGEPDQQDHLVDRAVHGHELAGNPHEPEGCEDRRQSDENGNESRNRGTNDEHENHERQDERNEPDLCDPAVDDLVERLLGRDACLGDVEVRMGLLNARRRGDDRVDVESGLVVGALRAERHEYRMPVVRDLALVTGGQRGTDVLDLLEARERRDRVVDGRAEGGIVDGLRLRLDDDDLAEPVLVEVERLVDDTVGLAGLADRGVLLLDHLHGHRDTDANEAMTNASQPNVAVFQWLALQRPMRAAMFLECFRGDMASSFQAC